MAQKPTEKLKEKLALSVLKHPWKWGMGVGALGIGKFAAAAAESIARQPEATDKIVGAVNLPLFLLEGVAILAEVFTFLMLIL